LQSESTTPVDAAGAYFGDTAATEFGFTFDRTIRRSRKWRRPSQRSVLRALPAGVEIKLLFERPTSDSTLLFNHRNKTRIARPGRSRFGTLDDNDGIELEYVDPSGNKDRRRPSTAGRPLSAEAAQGDGQRGAGVQARLLAGVAGI
jgi:hypothetical protein